jgi:methyl-accepting chemotaxis protein
MTPTSPPARDDGPAAPQSSQGLRLRIWLGCLGGALIGAAGMWWIVGTHTGPTAPLDLPVFISWLVGVAALGILVAVAFAFWLDRGIIGHLRGLSNGLASGRVSDLRGLPAGAGWGELSRLTQQIQVLLTHQRQIARTGEDLGLLRTQLGAMRGSLERWMETDRWEGLGVEAGALAPLAESLDRGMRRLDEARDRTLGSARQIGAGVASALADAGDTAGEAERGFVEATALLTTVRELHRLGGELEQSLAAIAAAPGGADPQASADWRESARAAIHELVESSSASVDHLGRGLLRVQEIAEQVHLVANRATLIALNAALSGARQGRPEPEMMELSDEMKRLAAEVRTATERTTVLSREVEGEVGAAIERMRGVRQRVAQRLEELPAPAPPEAARPTEPARLLERMKEMIQDAAQKGERLSAAGERVSTAAERLVHRLEEELQELKGMTARLASPAPPRNTAADPLASPRETTSFEPTAPPAPGLKLLGQEHLLPGEESARDRRRTGGPGTGRGESA